MPVFSPHRMHASISSALNDTRFFPIQPSELSSLDVSVSLLVKYEQARHWEDWEVSQFMERLPPECVTPFNAPQATFQSVSSSHLLTTTELETGITGVSS